MCCVHRPKWSSEDVFIYLMLPLAIVMVIIGFGIGAWYASGVQADVYRRQGVEMSQWEVFVGAKPVVRQIVDPGR